jgi:glutamyl-tRNA synthetase
MAELIKDFDISKISKAEPKFDDKEVYKLNHSLLSETPYKDAESRLKSIRLDSCSEDFWLLIRGNIDLIKEAKAWWDVIYGDITKLTETPSADKSLLKTALDLLTENTSAYQADWGRWFSDIKSQAQRSGRELYAPIRLCLTGQEHGPELKPMLQLMSPDLIKSRLQAGAK